MKRYYAEKNILLEKVKGIYFFIPKVACTSLKSSFANLLEIEYKGNVHFAVDFPCVERELILNNYGDYFKFAFVRNPWDRVVSCYKSKIKAASVNNDYIINGVEFNFTRYGNLFYGGMSFESFVDSICNIEDSRADSHFASQYLNIVDNRGQLLVDFIGKFETLNEDIKIVRKELDFDFLLPHLHKSKGIGYKEFYQNEIIIDKVRQRFKKDIETFNYSF